MKEPSNKSEVANWCIVNALRLPNELIVSITAKLMQHLTDDERDQVLRLSSVVGRSEQLVCDCPAHTFYEWEKVENKCTECGKPLYAN
jgi:hypothetical protein